MIYVMIFIRHGAMVVSSSDPVPTTKCKEVRAMGTTDSCTQPYFQHIIFVCASRVEHQGIPCPVLSVIVLSYEPTNA